MIDIVEVHSRIMFYVDKCEDDEFNTLMNAAIEQVVDAQRHGRHHVVVHF